MSQQRLDQILAERQKLSEQMKPLYEALKPLEQQDKKLAIEMAKLVDPVDLYYFNKFNKTEEA